MTYSCDEIPEDWKIKKLGNCLTLLKDGTHASHKDFENGIPLLSAKDIIGNNVAIPDNCRKISQEDFNKIHSRYKLQNKDILLTIVGTLGRTAIIKEYNNNYTLQRSVAILRFKNNYSPDFYNHFFNTDYFQLELLKRKSVSAQPGVYLGDLSKISVFVPPLAEQERIAEILETWDEAIEKTEKLITTKQKQFDWLVKDLINNKKHKKNHISSFITEISKRNKNASIVEVLSVTNHSGFVLPEKHFGHRVASEDVSNYKIVEQGQYAYNPSRINVGSIARLDIWKVGILSPMYVVFKIDNKKVNSDFFLHWLSSSEAKQRIKNSSQRSVRETVGFGELGSIPFPIPTLEEQKRIANILNTAKAEIDLLKDLKAKYQTQKKGLMQKLLTGKWRI